MRHLDEIAAAVALASAEERAEKARELRDRCLAEDGVYLASLGTFYRAIAAREVAPITVPALNIRGLTYDLARAIWRAAIKKNAGPIVFELAPSEARAGDQSFLEYTALATAAAVREGYRGPLFFQGDHFHVNTEDASDIAGLCREAIDAGMWQLDIDAADLMPASADQHPSARNAIATAAAAALIRAYEPSNADIVIGGEIGVIGGANTSPADLRAFMSAFRAAWAHPRGLGKISVQSGTRHGGVVQSDGSVGAMPLDLALLRDLSAIARQEFGLPGVVQHGASTLSLAQLAQLPTSGAMEVHLATALQNLVFDHPLFPAALRQRMIETLRSTASGDAEGGGHTEADALTAAQQFYHQRWQAWGLFKRDLWMLPLPVREALAAACGDWCDQLFVALRTSGRGDEVRALYERRPRTAEVCHDASI